LCLAKFEGAPVILIETETLDEPPTSTVHALPEFVHTSSFTVTWEGWDSESGVWAYDVQVRDGAGGEWQDWQQMMPLTSAQFTDAQGGHTYYFRSRAVDGVGNREPWPALPQAHTTFNLPELYFSATVFFADEDANGVFSPTSEITLTQVTLRLVDKDGQDVITPTTSGAFTATVEAGQTYTLWAESGDYMQVVTYTVPPGVVVHVVTYTEFGLWPARWLYLPLIARDG
jgi:hypothetical protein